jgi:hypothetical protein
MLSNEEDIGASEVGPAELSSIMGGAWFLMPATHSDSAVAAFSLNFCPAPVTTRAIDIMS